MGYRKIRITPAGANLPNNEMSAGRIFTMTDMAAAQYVGMGYAEYVTDPVPETAALETPEKAVMPKAKSKMFSKKKS